MLIALIISDMIPQEREPGNKGPAPRVSRYANRMTTLEAGRVLLAAFAAVLGAQNKTTLLPDATLDAISGEASGAFAKHTVADLGRMHRVHGSPGFHQAAEYIAGKAREYGLDDVHIESFPADGKTTDGTFRAYYGWQADSGVLTEVAPRRPVSDEYLLLPHLHLRGRGSRGSHRACPLHRR